MSAPGSIACMLQGIQSVTLPLTMRTNGYIA